MHLLDLVRERPQPAARSVPPWMLGLFRRHCISFADGSSDTDTQVFWLQSRNFSIDLRLPVDAEQVATAQPWHRYPATELAVLANYEGWIAESRWDGARLSWHEPTSLQLHDRWPEPALLRRVGNCMMEFADSGAYVEDWRLQPSASGPLIGLRLLEERASASGALRRCGGGLIVCGEHAGLVLGRIPGKEPARAPLPQQVVAAADDPARLQLLLDMETSIARGALADGFVVTHSTRPGRLGQPLCTLEGFEPCGDQVLQRLAVDGEARVRRFAIDTLEPELAFPQTTAIDAAARAWLQAESATLQRYARSLI